MTAAIFGLLGVVVGGLLTGGVDYFMARRREQAELRQSTRLVADELHSLWLVVDLILERGQLLPARLPGEDTELLFPTGSWHAHKAVLACALRQKEWIALATVYAPDESSAEHAVNEIRELISIADEPQPPRPIVLETLA